jgi:hypothetical protein
MQLLENVIEYLRDLWAVTPALQQQLDESFASIRANLANDTSVLQAQNSFRNLRDNNPGSFSILQGLLLIILGPYLIAAAAGLLIFIWSLPTEYVSHTIARFFEEIDYLRAMRLGAKTWLEFIVKLPLFPLKLIAQLINIVASPIMVFDRVIVSSIENAADAAIKQLEFFALFLRPLQRLVGVEPAIDSVARNRVRAARIDKFLDSVEKSASTATTGNHSTPGQKQAQATHTATRQSQAHSAAGQHRSTRVAQNHMQAQASHTRRANTAPAFSRPGFTLQILDGEVSTAGQQRTAVTAPSTAAAIAATSLSQSNSATNTVVANGPRERTTSLPLPQDLARIVVNPLILKPY